jgi:hypothetical protein
MIDNDPLNHRLVLLKKGTQNYIFFNNGGDISSLSGHLTTIFPNRSPKELQIDYSPEFRSRTKYTNQDLDAKELKNRYEKIGMIHIIDSTLEKSLSVRFAPGIEHVIGLRLIIQEIIYESERILLIEGNDIKIFNSDFSF